MSHVTVRIPAPLRSLTGGASELPGDGPDAGSVLRAVTSRHQGLADRVFDERGALRPFVNVFIGSENLATLQGLETPTKDGDVLSILPAVAGGRRS